MGSVHFTGPWSMVYPDGPGPCTTVPPESTYMYSYTKVLPQPIRRLTSRSRLGKDVKCRNFTEVLPRFAAAHNTVVNGKTR